MNILLFHADKPPEFKDVAPCTRVAVPDPHEKEEEGSVTYEWLGKVITHVTPPDAEPQIIAEIRTFAHPDVLAEIRAKGSLRTLHSEFEA